jgi:hypothetical protein
MLYRKPAWKQLEQPVVAMNIPIEKAAITARPEDTMLPGEEKKWVKAILATIPENRDDTY